MTCRYYDIFADLALRRQPQLHRHLRRLGVDYDTFLFVWLQVRMLVRVASGGACRA